MCIRDRESYKKLFKVENERCDEMIFSLQCLDHPDYTQKKNRGFGNRCLPPDPSGNGLGWNNYIINPQFAESYENRDGSKFNWDDIIPGYNDMGIDKRMVYFLRNNICLLYTSPSPRDRQKSRMPSSA